MKWIVKKFIVNCVINCKNYDILINWTVVDVVDVVDVVEEDYPIQLEFFQLLFVCFL